MKHERTADRRTFLQAIVAGTAPEWPAIGGNPHRSPPKPKVHWTVDVEEPVRVREVFGDTILAEGEETAWALSITDGTVAWEFEAEEERPAFVGVSESTAYVKDARGVHAISRSNGSVSWTIEDGNVVALDSSTTYVATRSAVTALDPKSGAVQWVTELPGGDLLDIGVHEPGELVYVGDTRGNVHALSIEEGAVRWQFETPGRHHVRPLSSRELAPNRFVRTAETIVLWNKREHRVHALSRSGEEQWQFVTNSESTTFPGTCGAESVFVVRENAIRALAYDDGRTRWQYEVDGQLSPHPRAAGESVYVTDSDGRVHALGTANGSIRWIGTPDIGSAIFLSEVDEGTVTASNMRGEVAALSDADGERRWSVSTGEEVRWFPQLGNGTVYVGSNAGKIYALDVHETQGGFLGTSVSPTRLGGGIVGGLALGATYYLTRSRRRGEDARTNTTWNDFELLEPGDGPTSERFRARAPDGEVVALERFDGVSRDEFTAAIETWLGLDHEGVLPVREWGTDPEPWVATADPEGGRLADHLDDLDRRAGVEVVSTIAEVVHRAHREGVTHGRLHPGNVLFGDADREEVFVGGWLDAAARADLPRGFAAPEQEDDSGAESVAVDVYQLGALACHVLLGESPSGAEIEVDEGPDDLADVLATARASDPGDRFDSALRFRDVLRWAYFQG